MKIGKKVWRLKETCCHSILNRYLRYLTVLQSRIPPQHTHTNTYTYTHIYIHIKTKTKQNHSKKAFLLLSNDWNGRLGCIEQWRTFPVCYGKCKNRTKHSDKMRLCDYKFSDAKEDMKRKNCIRTRKFSSYMSNNQSL